MPSLLPPFAIHQPASLNEASAALLAHPDDARPYAGGTELLLVMKHGGLRYDHLVDLKTIPGLDRIEERDGSLWIGSLVTHRTIERSPLVGRRLPALAEMTRHVANARVRATGTLGGNLCFAEPHSDPATLLLCLDARYHLSGPAGERTLPADELVRAPYETALADGELLTAIEIPLPAAGWAFEYRKFQVTERPTLGLGLGVQIAQSEADGPVIQAARLAIGSASPTPRRAPAAETLLRGPCATADERLPAAAAALADAADLLDDLDASAEYKRHLIAVFLRQAFARLTESAP